MKHKNDLLDQDIKEKIADVRYEKPEAKDTKRPIFYLFIVFLVTLSVVLSLMRFF